MKDILLGKIQELESLCFDNMGDVHQITIDFVQDSYLEISQGFDDGIGEEMIGVWVYHTESVLEIIDKSLKKDYEILKKLNDILNDSLNNKK